MAFVETVSASEATGELATLYQETLAHLGYLPNYVRAFSARPAVLRAWAELNGAIKAGSDQRRYELATVAAARRLRSSYCALAHGKILAERFLGADGVRSLPAGLDEADVAVVQLAEKVVDDATSISATDIEHLRTLGLRDEEIVSVVLAAAARCFFSKTLDALGVQPDALYAELQPDLRDVLTVGRPIEANSTAARPLTRA
jgi:uncharacterized peroxidase-related enzyme